MRSLLPGLTRRRVLQIGAAAALLPGVKPFAWAQGKSGLHALSVFGEFKYPPDFTHFDYLNPDAPKGGKLNFQVPNWSMNQSTQTFNTLNSFVLTGDAPPRMEMCFTALMTGSADEADALYCLAAQEVSVSDDGNIYTFTMRPEARFHDGSPLTAEDAAFSLNILKEKGHPNISQLMREMVSAEAPDPATLVVTLSGKQSRDTILTIAGTPIFSRAYYDGKEFTASTMEPPLGSGAYKVGAFRAGSFIEYERVPDYWAADLPVARGTNNFDVIRIDFYREREAAFEAFKKGDITYREEFTSLTWATQYNFPAVADGRVKKSLFPSEAIPSMQGWWINTRRPKFADPRTREAIGLAFDFEWTNRNLFYGAYARTASFFQKSDFMAEGEPSAEELALMQPLKDKIANEAAFGAAYVPPETDGSGRDRRPLQRASQLLEEAGWTRRGAQLVDANGQPLTVEFLIDAQVFERVLAPYGENLKRIGIASTIRQIDPAQYQARQRDWDFDVVGSAYSLSATPLDGMSLFFSSRAADAPGTYNNSGIKEPAVDELLDRLPQVSSREELVTIMKVIDRILRAKHYWIPNWYSPEHRVAHWDIFGWPEAKPDYGFSPESTWWLNAERAASLGKGV